MFNVKISIEFTPEFPRSKIFGAMLWGWAIGSTVLMAVGWAQ